MDSKDLVEDNSSVELPLEVQESLAINPTDPENPDESVSAEFTEILSDIKERKTSCLPKLNSVQKSELLWKAEKES